MESEVGVSTCPEVSGRPMTVDELIPPRVVHQMCSSPNLATEELP